MGSWLDESGLSVWGVNLRYDQHNTRRWPPAHRMTQELMVLTSFNSKRLLTLHTLYSSQVLFLCLFGIHYPLERLRRLLKTGKRQFVITRSYRLNERGPLDHQIRSTTRCHKKIYQTLPSTNLLQLATLHLLVRVIQGSTNELS